MIEELHEEKVKFLEEKANEIRQLIIEMLLEAGSGHSAGPLGMADIFSAFYFHILRHNPQKPDWPDRDRLILSNGHICPVRYAAMALAGYFPIEELKTLRKINSRLQGHPHRTALPGVETTSGPLGEGISQAIGIAYAGILDKKDYHVYCITSDGEIQEGNTWEALMWLGNNPLPNLTIIIDRNYIQIDGFTEDVMPLEPLKQKLEAFKLHVLEVDGHNIRAFVDAIREARSEWRRTSVIIAYTIPGKGVSFMEKKYEWHGKPPKQRRSKKSFRRAKNIRR
jgi:transketolase